MRRSTSAEVRVLQAARARIERAGRICQMADARDEDDSPCRITHPLARSWCITASILLEANEYHASLHCTAIYYLAGALKKTASLRYRANVKSLQEWGDGEDRSLAEVLNLFDRAIIRAQAAPQLDVEFDGEGDAIVRVVAA